MSVSLASPCALSTPSRQFRHRDGRPPRVLYAEDQTGSRVVTTALLKRMGLIVDAVEDGELALRQAEHTRYDIILLDIEMPVMDGVTAARCIRALENHATTPILALSAFLADSTENSVWRGAFDHALPKPANGNELHKAISLALAHYSPPHSTSLNTALPVVIHPQMTGAITHGLKAVLPTASWQKLHCMAATEAMHYANATVMSCEIEDLDTQERCLLSLKSLAESFEAPLVASHITDIIAMMASGEKLSTPKAIELLNHIQEWQKRAKNLA